MAKQGKIDPWNVDIVEVTDKYLMHLFQSKAQNLRLTGRTLLFAAILLKLKSNVLEGIDVLDFEPQHQDEFNYDDEMPLDYEEEYIPTNNVISIDEVLPRRTSVRPVSYTPLDVYKRQIPQLARITISRGRLLNLRWPYHAKVIKIFDINNKIIGAMCLSIGLF